MHHTQLASLTDEIVLEHARSSDRTLADRATKVLHARYYRQLMRILGDDDLVQETFIKVLQVKPPVQSVQGLIFSIAVSLGRNAARKAGRRARLLGVQASIVAAAHDHGESDELAGMLTVDEGLQRILDALPKLAPDLHVVMTLRNEGLTLPDIAATLGLSLDVVQARNKTAVRRLRALLAEVEGPFRGDEVPTPAESLDVRIDRIARFHAASDQAALMRVLAKLDQGDFNVYKRPLELAKSADLAAEDHVTIAYTTNDPEQAELLEAMQPFIRAELTERDPFASQAIPGHDDLERLR